MSIKNIIKLSFVDNSSNIHTNSRISRLCKLKNVIIDEFSYVANNTHIINTEIGKFCSIGPFTNIGLGKHPTNMFSTSPLFYSKNNIFNKIIIDQQDYKEFEPIFIKNDVWVGSNSIILDGITVGNGAIIAAGAVVTKDVPDYAIVAGIPAKVIKFRFTREIIEELIKIKWWELSLKQLEQIKMSYSDINQFINAVQLIRSKQ